MVENSCPKGLKLDARSQPNPNQKQLIVHLLPDQQPNGATRPRIFTHFTGRNSGTSSSAFLMSRKFS